MLVGTAISDHSSLYCGVPQSSVLGPVLEDTTCGSCDGYVGSKSSLLWRPTGFSAGICIGGSKCGSWDGYVGSKSCLLWRPIEFSVGTCVVGHNVW